MACVTPASASLSSTWSINALPATGTSGFGSVSVSGRMRLPRPADARVLQHRDEIVGRGPHQGILEVEQADARGSLALGEPQEVRRMVVAQHPGGGLVVGAP